MKMINLKRFFGIGKFTFKDHSAYRFDMFIWMLLIPMFLVVEYFLWKSLFAVSGETIIKGFTFSAMITYYMMSHITMAITHSSFDRKIAHLVKSGKLIRYVVKPITYFRLSLYRNTWNSLFRAIKYTPTVLIVGYFLIPTLSFNALNTGLYLISLTLAMLLKFAYIFSFGLFSFWLKEYGGVKIIRDGIDGLLRGMLIPLVFFPIVFQKAFFFFPWQYMLYVPIQIFLGAYSFNETLVMLAMQAIWVLIFMLIAIVVWKKAFSKFMAVGV
jgi:ABC-2 type transport system permease protein